MPLFRCDDYATPLVGLMKKDLGAGGSTWEQTVGVNNPQGGANAYANSYDNSDAGLDVVFTGNYKKRFAGINIQHFTIMSSRNQEGGVEKVLVKKIDDVKREFMQALEFQSFRDDGGAMFQLDATALTGASTTLTATSDTRWGVQFVKKGKKLNFSANSDGTSLVGGATPETVTVTGRSVLAGTLTVAAAGPATASYYGYEDGTATAALCGLQSWCPKTNTLANSTFKGVARGQDLESLGGLRLAALGMPMKQVVQESVTLNRTLGGDPDVILCHPTRYLQLKEELGDNVEYTEVKGRKMVGGDNSISFEGFVVASGGRPCAILEAPACQTDITWCLDTGKVVA